MELLTFTIAAGETKEFRKAGRYIEIIESTYACTLLLIGADGNQTDDAVNALSGIFIEESYSAIQVRSANAQSITLLIHDGRGGSRRQPGVVQVIDGGRARSLAGQALSARDASTGASGRVPFIVVWNAANSGVRLIIKQIVVSAASAGDIFIGHTSTQRTPTTFLQKKVSPPGSASTTSRLQTGDDTGISAGMTAFWQQPAQANVATIVRFDDPVIVLPGYGMAVAQNLAAGAISATIEATEEPNT